MTKLTVRDGKLLVRSGKIGTEQECCCQAGECTQDSECCSCVASFFYFDPETMQGLDCTTFPGFVNVGPGLGNCLFVGEESFPCPVGAEQYQERAVFCNQKYGAQAAIAGSVSPEIGGHCCSGICQKSCDEADPP